MVLCRLEFRESHIAIRTPLFFFWIGSQEDLFKVFQFELKGFGYCKMRFLHQHDIGFLVFGFFK